MVNSLSIIRFIFGCALLRFIRFFIGYFILVNYFNRNLRKYLKGLIDITINLYILHLIFDNICSCFLLIFYNILYILLLILSYYKPFWLLIQICLALLIIFVKILSSPVCCSQLLSQCKDR
jgi:hypothetical protein